MKKYLTRQFLFTLLIALVAVSCQEDNDLRQYEEGNISNIDRHTPAVIQLIKICEHNAEIKQLLQHAISQAAKINPDRNYNPAQTLEEFYSFVDYNVLSLPWDVLPQKAITPYGKSLYGRVDQGIGYFWFVVDQPLEELSDRGFYYPTIEFVEPFSTWLNTYSQSWGNFLDTEDSWNDTYYNLLANDPDWGLDKGWYGEGNQWKTFNEFFARKLASPEVRPIADSEVVAPADSWPKGLYPIDENSQLVYPEDVQIKTAKLSDITALIGIDSKYCEAFAGGTLTHTFLDVNCYHRYHAPVDGKLLELRTIPGVAAGGGYTLWDNEQKLYYYVNNMGFQMVETRACAIIETEQYGLVAMLPVGMSQICSVNWIASLKPGQQLKRGDEMGFFQFGGSDVIMIFQQDVEVELLNNGENLVLMGEPYARLKVKNET